MTTKSDCRAGLSLVEIYLHNFCSTGKPEMRAEHLTKWLETYHDQFSYKLNVFGYDANSVYPFAKFQQDVHDVLPHFSLRFNPTFLVHTMYVVHSKCVHTNFIEK